MQFQKGQSGNPRGRPRRTENQKEIREAIRQAVPGIVERLIESASTGDVSAAKLLLERALPALRPVDLPVQVNLDGSLSEAGRSVLAALGEGIVTPEQGSRILGGIGSLARIVETDELIRRIEALEAEANGKPTE